MVRRLAQKEHSAELSKLALQLCLSLVLVVATTTVGFGSLPAKLTVSRC